MDTNFLSLKTFAAKIVAFNKQLAFSGPLPEKIRIINPFKENKQALTASTAFYNKFYNDNNPRHLILGINPGRFGAGATGVPFTDSKRLKNECGIGYEGKETHEPSSVFVYEMIHAFGGVEKFYGSFYINSVFPLAIVTVSHTGKEVNHNYYDSPALTKALYTAIVDNIRKQLAMGVQRDVCFCFGKGKNEKFLKKLNEEFRFFEKIVALEHPRFIMQYKSKTKDAYIGKYLDAFRKTVS